MLGGKIIFPVCGPAGPPQEIFSEVFEQFNFLQPVLQI